MKNGKNKAHIEVEIIANDRGGTVTFCRNFDKHAKESFSIDDRKMSKKEYVAQVKTYNIQVGNLCMFLPQDRVQDFTKMNPQELLFNTQISVCSPEVNETFNKLLAIRDKQKNNTKENEDLKTQLDDNKNRNEQLRVLIEGNRQKDELIAKVDMIMTKKLWCDFNKNNDETKVIETDLVTLTNKIKRRTAELKPFKDKQLSLVKAKTELKNIVNISSSNITATLNQLDKLQDVSEKLESDVNNAKQEMRNLVTSIQDQKKHEDELMIMINLDKKDVQEAMKETASAQDMMRKCDEKIHSLKLSTSALSQKRAKISNNLENTVVPAMRMCERKISVLGDTQRQRIETLRSMNEHAFRAHEWLKANRQNFRGKIFNPIITEITVDRKENAKYLENAIATKDLVAFICTDKEDMAKLIRKFRNDMNLQVNLAYSEDTEHVQFEPPCDISEYPAHLGLHSFMIDMVDGPVPIINYLCRLFSIHNIVIGDDRTFQHASQVPNECRLFFSSNHRFQVTMSRYSKGKSTASAEIYPRNLLSVGVDNSLKEKEERNLAKWQQDAQKLREERSAVEQEITQIEEQGNEIRNKKKEIQGKLQKLQMSQEKLRKKERNLETLRNRKVDIEAERKKFKGNVDRIVAKLLKVNDQRVDTLVEYKQNQIQSVLGKQKLQIFDSSTGNVDEEIRKIESEIATTSSLAERIRERFNEAKKRCKSIENELLKLTNGVLPSDPKFKSKNEFQALSDDIEELQNEMADLQGRIECMRGVDPQVIVDYEERIKLIVNLEKQLSSEANRLVKMEEELNTLHDIWYPEIEKMIEVINQKFSNFFQLMGFVGQVELLQKEKVNSWLCLRNPSSDFSPYSVTTPTTAFKFACNTATARDFKCSIVTCNLAESELWQSPSTR